MELDNVKKMLTLNSIKVLGMAPYPARDNWGYLQEILEELHSENLLNLSENEEFYYISLEGNKAVLFFQSMCKEQIANLNAYEEVFVDNRYIDARLPLVSFYNRYKLTDEQISQNLFGLGIFLYWKDLLTKITRLEKEAENWQQQLLDGSIFNDIARLADPNGWLLLGRNARDAERTATFLIDPEQAQVGLVQITR